MLEAMLAAVDLSEHRDMYIFDSRRLTWMRVHQSALSKTK
jgi:hypothetical protein